MVLVATLEIDNLFIFLHIESQKKLSTDSSTTFPSEFIFKFWTVINGEFLVTNNSQFRKISNCQVVFTSNIKEQKDNHHYHHHNDNLNHHHNHHSWVRYHWWVLGPQIPILSKRDDEWKKFLVKYSEQF